MAPLNPNAPIFVRTFTQFQLQYSPRPTLSPPMIHYHHYNFNQNFYHPTNFLYTLPSPPPPLIPVHYKVPYYTHEFVPRLPIQLTSPAEVRKVISDQVQVEGGSESECVDASSGPRKLKRWSSLRRWKKKEKSQKKPFHDVLDEPKDFEFKELEMGLEEKSSKTTVMIKNLPNKLDKEKVLKLVDEHCMKANKKVELEGGTNFSEFNFLYLPMDFRSGSNLGYAFVNFTTPLAARRLYRELHQKSWSALGSSKVCHVTYARIQGLPALLKHFRNSTFICETDDYLPVYFLPNRNGFRLTEQRCIGKHVPKAIA